MTLEQFNQIAEIVGAFGVIASLIYLAFQIRHNTRAVQLNTGHAVSKDLRALFNVCAENGPLSELFFRGHQDLESLDGVEQFRFYSMMHDFYFAYQNAYFQMKSGTLDPRYWAATLAPLLRVSSTPASKLYWENRKNWYTPEFRDYFEGEHAAQPPDSNYRVAGT